MVRMLGGFTWQSLPLQSAGCANFTDFRLAVIAPTEIMARILKGKCWSSSLNQISMRPLRLSNPPKTVGSTRKASRLPKGVSTF